jgi:hypothetical protein
MLAYELGISKCVSERHIYASSRKLTAGNAAKQLTKLVGRKVLAADIKEFYQMHFHHEAEWHHSGFYRGGSGKTMGRTFFISDEEVQELAEHYTELVQQRADTIARREAEEKRQRETRVMGFYWTWDYDYSGNHGKKRNHKVLHAYEGDELNQPNHFTPCNAATLKRVKTVVGRKYYGWDEPKLEEFSKKAFDEEARKKAEHEALMEAVLKREREERERRAAERERRAAAQEAHRERMQKQMEKHIETFLSLDLSSTIPEHLQVSGVFSNNDIKAVTHSIVAATGLDYQVCLAFVNSKHFAKYRK